VNEESNESHLKYLLQLKIGRQIIIGGLVNRASYSGLILVTFLFVQHKVVSFSIVGLIMGSITLGLAIGRLFQGLMADRIGFRNLLLLCGVLHLVVVIAFTFLLRNVSSSIPLASVAVLLGLSAPATSPITRAMWANVVPKSNLKSAQLLESTINEVACMLGPAITGIGCLIISLDSMMLVTGGLVSTGAFILGLSKAAEKWRRIKHSSGSYFLKSLFRIILLGLTAGIAGGLIEVAVPAFAINAGSPLSSGFLLTCWGIGSSIGGFAMITLGVRVPIKIRMRVSVLILGATAYLMSMSSSIEMLAFLVFLHGLPAAPAWSTLYSLADQRNLKIRETEKYSWILAVSTAGVALGNYLGGNIISIWGVAYSFIGGGSILMIIFFLIVPVFNSEK
jgi:predicted MFS family arabinose efflux permease